FDIPNTWVRAILRDVCFLSDGEKISGTTLPYLDAKYLRGKKNVEFRDNGKLIFKGEYAILVDGENSGEVFSIPEDGIMGSTFKKLIITPFMEAKFILYFLEYYRSFFRNNKKGAAIPHLNKELFAYTPIGIPPLEEQKRIVAKISEIFTVLDEIEKLQSKYSSNQDALKDKVLDAAIKGKLVPQDPNDEPASILLEKIAKEKEKLIKEGKIKKQKSLTPITEDEIPFDIPNSWEWVRLGNIATLTMGQSPKGTAVHEGGDGIEFHQGKICFTQKYLCKSSQKTNEPNKIVEPNTLLLCVRAPVGTVNITQRRICIGRGLCGINIHSGMDSDFMFYWLTCLKNDFIKKATGTTFIAITGNIIEEELIPLPPLEEQKRIVAKIEELMPLIEEFSKA
ncbi:MAG: restriction endonuclease subunit S, partial [Succinivibrionaceae bacterium]|nr:restriction endonuclease subunit S [Succinivibrionaceae bacterium]